MTEISDDPAAATAEVELRQAVGQAWRTFLERCEPLRPELYRYCRYLTASPWDADDLVQDTLSRAFVTLGHLHQELSSPRAWMFRVASNLWLNRVRDARETPTEPSRVADSMEHSAATDPRATREAAGTLFSRLSPQERAAVVLKDVFDFSLEEVATALSTSVGAIKAALHRGRRKAVDPEPAREAVPVPAVLDAFCAAFNARDLDGVTALLLEDAVFEFPGLAVEYGIEAARRGSLAGVLHGDPTSDRSGVAPQYRVGLRPRPPRLEARPHRGEVLLLGWFDHDDGEAVRAISKASISEGRIAHLRTWVHAPEVLAEVCGELGVPFRSSGHRYWW